jgi:hypothetical protein
MRNNLSPNSFINNRNTCNKEVGAMGKDRQERKMKQSRRVESDRDQSLQYPGATGLDTSEQARKQNRH